MERLPLIKEKTAEKLRAQIYKMRSDSYVKIDSERSLAEQLGVSRVSLRSAMKALVDEGLLMQIQGKGTYITPGARIHSLHIICSPDIKRNDPFYNKFLVEITGMAAKNSINLVMLDPEQLKAPTDSSPLVVAGLLEISVLCKLKSLYKTIIAIQDYSGLDDVIQIYFDDYKIGQQAAKTLLEYNHKNIIHLAGPEAYPSALYRKSGFMDVLENTSANVTVVTEKMNWAGGYRAADLLIEMLDAKEHPTAVFAANDWMAAGLIQKLKEKGVGIPEDLSIIGCDDISIASEFSPALTTFNLDMKHLTLEILSALNRIDAPEIYLNKRILLPATLVIRESLTKL